MGVRLWLDMSPAEIAALAVPEWKKTVCTALATYGAFMGDTGGPGFGFMLESGISYESFGYQDPVVAYAAAHDLPVWEGARVFNFTDGVPWSTRLRVVVPPAP